jgi:hypothetical protein
MHWSAHYEFALDAFVSGLRHSLTHCAGGGLPQIMVRFPQGGPQILLASTIPDWALVCPRLEDRQEMCNAILHRFKPVGTPAAAVSTMDSAPPALALLAHPQRGKVNPSPRHEKPGRIA